ncbi:VRR-NUC domain-containing protein [Accumulibacter sp.]|uniref:VRR-NUC domain-containing protein n=1 Tax=Accumulibacter sp. TaxID=2053492 RepID=UPI0025D71A2D|nr:VRR-NUC domain-containing protein [Accumulibacter sp.]MCM8595147.1 VRR-NUC domain-containing protein [Accumulibacter sp.]MCM8626190.1 VRR-NUC domain-containing protein [Accumulibacter sp.]MDS4049293.1 VRR-NUC domain-containing protein [Accumulibacter sp.]
MLERDIEDYLVRRAKAFGGEVRKVRWIGRRGAPDRIVFLPGSRLYWVEVKAPGTKAQPHQAREHERMRGMGQAVLVIDSIAAIEALLT